MTEESIQSRDEILKILEKIKAGKIKGELYFLLKKAGQLVIKKGDLDSSTQIKLSRNFASQTYNFFDDDELKVMSLTEADDRKKVIYQYDYTDPLEEFTYIDSVQKSLDYEEFNSKTDFLSEIKGYIFAFVHMGARLTLYKENYEMMMVKKNEGQKISERINIVLTQSSQLKEFEDEIFRLNFNFDFMMLNGELFIKELGKLEQRFGFQEVVKKKAKESIHEIGKLNLVKNISSLEEDIEDIAFARKIVKVASRSVVLQICDKKDIMEFISDYDDTLKKKFKVDETGEYISLDTKVSKDAFLKLLDDAYLYSQLTKHKYVSGSKDDFNKV